MDSLDSKFDSQFITLQSVGWPSHFGVADSEDNSNVDFDIHSDILLDDSTILDHQQLVPHLPTTNTPFDDNTIKLQPYLSNKNKWNVMHKQKTFLFLRAGRTTIDWQCTLKCRKTIKTTFLNGDDVQLLKDVEHKEDCEPKMRPKLMKNFVFENFVFDSIKAVCLRVDGYRFKRNGGKKKEKTYWKCVEKKCPATAFSTATSTGNYVYLIKDHDVNVVGHHSRDDPTSIKLEAIDSGRSMKLQKTIENMSLPTNFIGDASSEDNSNMDFEPETVLNENIVDQQTVQILPTTNTFFDENSIKLKPYLSKKHKWNVRYKQKSFLFLRSNRTSLDWQCTLGCKRTIKTTFLNAGQCKLMRDIEHKESCEHKIKATPLDNCRFEYDACNRAVSLIQNAPNAANHCYTFKRSGGVKKCGTSYWKCTNKNCNATASSSIGTCVRLIKSHNH